MILALARHFDWHANRMYTEFPVDGGLADLVQISRAGYLTEIEIKVSMSDWRADEKKEKFRAARPHVSRFFYAVPEPLADRIPPFVPETAGILAVWTNEWSVDHVRTVRQAKRIGRLKVEPNSVRYMERNLYYRFWNSELSRIGRTLQRERAA